MPRRRTNLTFAAVAMVGVLLVTGCAGTKDHTWQGEFTERLEGSKALVEETAGGLRPSSSDTQVFQAGIELGRKLEFRRELIEGLNPPAACEEVQEAGANKLSRLAQKTYDLYKNLNPFLRRQLPRILKEESAGIGKIEHEAESCE
jgi:hypothetical protein